MSKYKLGETSAAVTNKKNAITKSILKKAELIDAIISVDDAYTTLNIKGDSISEVAVHKWSDNDLDILGLKHTDDTFNNNFRNSVNSLDNTISVLNTRVRNLEITVQENRDALLFYRRNPQQKTENRDSPLE